MEIYNRLALANLIFTKLELNKGELQNLFGTSKNNIGFFYLDDLLPDEIALKIHEVFPSTSQMILKKSIREDKYIAAQMNKYNSLLEEIIYAFQDKRIVELIAELIIELLITKLLSLSILNLLVSFF